MNNCIKSSVNVKKIQFSLYGRPFGAFHYERFDDYSFREAFVQDFIANPEAALGYRHFVKTIKDTKEKTSFGALQLIYILPTLPDPLKNQCVQTFNAIIPTVFDEEINGWRVGYHYEETEKGGSGSGIAIDNVTWANMMGPDINHYPVDEAFRRYRNRLRRYVNNIFMGYAPSLIERNWLPTQSRATFFYGHDEKNYKGLFNSNASLALDGLNLLLALQHHGDFGKTALGKVLSKSAYNFRPTVHAYRNRRSSYEIKQGMINVLDDEEIQKVVEYYADNPLFGAF